ncbi:MAG TPA: hypothetical protein VIW92_10530 [Thermoanaerobaculia bacterium]
MSREKTYAGMLGEWQKFLAAMDANPDLAAMAEWRNKLASLLAQGVEISQQQAAMAASKQERSKQLQTLLADGNRLMTGMRKMIADRYGVRAEKLTEFGIPPFRGRIRKAKPGTEPENPEVPSPAQKS